MASRAFGTFLLSGALLWSVSATWADDYKLGDEVVVIADVKLRAEANGKGDRVWLGLVLRVAGIDGKWLRVSNGHPGWLDRRHVIPLDRRAIDFMTAMIRTDPGNAALYSARGNVWAHLGELDIAISDYNEAIRLNPTTAYGNRGLVWRAKGEYDKAISDYSEALRRNPNDAITYSNRGAAWTALGKHGKAIADFDQALRIDPTLASAYANRGNVWDEKGDHDKALADYTRALELKPKLVVAYNGRGLAWNAKREYDKALADFNQALRLDPNYAKAYVNRGLTRHDRGEFGMAIADYTEALRVDPQAAVTYFDRGAARCAEGDFVKAIADYTQTLRLAPQFKAARFNRSVAQVLSNKSDCLDGFRAMIRADDWTTRWSLFATINGHFAARRFKDNVLSERFLRDAGGKLENRWPYPVIAFLEGRLTESALLAAATDRDQQTEARCYLGLWHRLEGHREQAKVHFDWVRTNGNKRYAEYWVALEELRRLGN